MPTIQFKRATAATPVPLPTIGVPGEPTFAAGGFTNAPVHTTGNDLVITSGGAYHALIGPTRQVELIGQQNITGIKQIIGAGNIAFQATANMSFGDGAAGQVLQKGAGNAVVWGTNLATGVTTDGVTIGGNGLAATPLAVIPAIFGGAGLTWTGTPTFQVSLNQATQAAIGGGTVATAAQIATGTVDTAMVSPLGLRSQLGADAGGLNTVAKTLVPAVNEILSDLAALTGVVIFVGTYDATANQGTFNGQGGLTPGTGPLPAAAAGNAGFYLIVTVGGAGGVGNEPAGPIVAQDWLMSTGTVWQLLKFSSPTVAAINVSVNPAVAGATNVQAALTTINGIAQTALQQVFADPASFTGDGVAVGTQLTITAIDGGQY